MPKPWHEQEAFSLALLDTSCDPPAGLGPSGLIEDRFRVHRNNLFSGLHDVLAARFPVCRALVGEEFFADMARVFVVLSPPRSPVLLSYGDDLGDFIDSFAPASSVPHLGDMARLEAARSRAHHAADADPLSRDALASVPACGWERARVTLHPAVEIVTSTYPVLSIWESHLRQGAENEIRWTPEDVLITRPGLAVEMRRLVPGGAAFIAALSRGATFAQARSAACRIPGFDVVKILADLFASGALLRTRLA
jgi:hypothetical protein